MSETMEIRARFESHESLHQAVESLHHAGMEKYEVYSPVLHHETLEAHMPCKGSIVRPFTVLGGISGVVIGLSMCALSSLLYKLVTGGKPPVNLVPFVVVGFECTILFACLATVFGLVIMARLGPLAPPKDYDPRYSEDLFGVHVACKAEQRESVARLLKSAGALEVTDCDGGAA